MSRPLAAWSSSMTTRVVVRSPPRRTPTTPSVAGGLCAAAVARQSSAPSEAASRPHAEPIAPRSRGGILKSRPLTDFLLLRPHGRVCPIEIPLTGRPPPSLSFFPRILQTRPCVAPCSKRTATAHGAQGGLVLSCVRPILGERTGGEAPALKRRRAIPARIGQSHGPRRSRRFLAAGFPRHFRRTEPWRARPSAHQAPGARLRRAPGRPFP